MSYSAAREFITTLSSSYPNPQVTPLFEQLKNLHEKKLWHQLTIVLEALVNLPLWQTTKDEKLFTELNDRFIRDFETKLNQLKLVKIGLAIITHISSNENALAFLEKLSSKIHAESEKEAYALCLSEIAHLKLTKLNQLEASKTVADQVGTILEKITGADPVVYSSYYKYLSLYYKLKVAPTDFYKNALMYLVYTPLETIPLSEQQAFAFDMGIAALVAPDIHNFGELLQHPILKSLQGTAKEWLAHFLVAFNSGNIDKFNNFLVTNKTDIEGQPFLVASLGLLKQKVAVLALMELVFNKPSDERTLPFKVVAQATKLPEDEVELLLMRALSLKLVKGFIDQVNSVVTINWVQPRVLDLTQVAKMQERVQQWIDRTNQVLHFMEGSTAPELLT